MLQTISISKSKSYVMPTKVYFGRGSLQILPEVIKKQKVTSVLFVIGDHIKKDPEIQKILKEVPGTTLYPLFIKKSDYASIDALTDFVRKGNFDALVAVGGGAILDSGKCAAILAKHTGRISEYVETKTKTLLQKGLLFIALPTTSGTGSEVTPWATVWADNKLKYSLTSPFMFADIAIVDPQLTDSLPSSVTGESGIDALCQAIESYWNVNHNPTSDKYALESIKTILSSIEKTVVDPSKKTRDAMSYGSLLGGLAFSNTQTTICHSVSYPMTSHWGIPHGQATSLTLPTFIQYTLPVLPNKRVQSLLEALGSSTPDNAAEKIENLMKKIGLKTRLSELGISKEGIDLIVTEGFHPDRAKNAPRIPTREELKGMLLAIY